MTVQAWHDTVDGWELMEVRKPASADRRAPYGRESVVMHGFWDNKGKGLVFHRRWDPGTFCDPRNERRKTACGHAMPVEVAEKIARPCRKCWAT